MGLRRRPVRSADGSQTFGGRFGAVVSVAPHLPKPVRPLRGLVVMLRSPKEAPYVFNPSPSLRKEIEDERRDEVARLRRFAVELAKKFGLPRRAWSVRRRRGCYKLFVHLWEGRGTKDDHSRSRVISAWICRRAKKI